MAPSSRIDTPLSMMFSQIWRASAAYSPGCPRREGKELMLPSIACVIRERVKHGRMK